MLLMYGLLMGFFVLVQFFLQLFWCEYGHQLDVEVLHFLGFSVSFSFVFDYVSISFFSCVSFVSSMVLFYTIFYIGGTLDYRRFLYLVVLFVFSMMILVFSGRIFTTLIGWDGLGLVSFCLVIFYKNHSRLFSGILTVFTNRLGDAFIIVSMFFFFNGGLFNRSFGGLDSYWIFSLMFFFGLITKSAQVPFSSWLPAAIAAPTPVSSLVHSSTLVTAGVYVLIRFNFIFYNLFWLFSLSLLTMLMAGLGAVVEKDLKKLVAMSTLRQLGFMVILICLGYWKVSFFHMSFHAFFKSMLFLSTGFLMRSVGGGQDSRFLSGRFSNGMRFLFIAVRSLCLMGFPFFLGFFRKDLVLVILRYGWGGISILAFWFGCLFTITYRIRFVYVCYFYFYSNIRMINTKSSLRYLLPSIFLLLVCILYGNFFIWFYCLEFMRFLRGGDYILGLVIIFIGIVLFYIIDVSKSIRPHIYRIIFLFWLRSGGISSSLRRMFLWVVDFSWLESIGGKGVGTTLSILGSWTNLLTSLNYKFFLFRVPLILLFLR
jgi:NADH-ubiquinone oxidoreductase chain 5